MKTIITAGILIITLAGCVQPTNHSVTTKPNGSQLRIGSNGNGGHKVTITNANGYYFKCQEHGFLEYTSWTNRIDSDNFVTGLTNSETNKKLKCSITASDPKAESSSDGGYYAGVVADSLNDYSPTNQALRDINTSIANQNLILQHQYYNQ